MFEDPQFMAAFFRGLQEPVLTESFEDYHVPGVDYLCLVRDRATTVKLYVFDPERLVPNAQGWLVAPHDHAYEFHTVVLQGSVTNVLFDFDGFHSPQGETWMHSYENQPGGGGVTTPLLQCDLTVGSATTYRAGESYFLPMFDVHTLITSAQLTVLLLIQGPRLLPATKVFLPERADELAVADPSLYRPMSQQRAGEILDLARPLFKVPQRV